MKRTKGFTLVELLVVVAIIALLVSILLPTLGKAKELAKRAICGANLKSIGNSLVIYMAESDDRTPWLDDFSATAKTGDNADAANPTSLSATALMFLIVRSGQTADLFRCPSDENSVKMATTKHGADSDYYWDFCDTDSAEPGGRDCKRVSYSYQAPLSDGEATPSYTSGYTANSNGGLAVMADKTPVYDDKTITAWADGDENKDSMSQNHGDGDWINVLFADGHVKGGERADVGIGNDNIYSESGGLAGSRTSTGVDIANHTHEDDSFLIGPID